MSINALRNLSFGLLAVLTVVLAVLTVGTHFGWNETYYTSWPLITLWALTGVGSLMLLLRIRLYRRPCIFGLHISLLLILIGACVSHVCSKDGSLRLEVGGDPVFEINNGETDPIRLPEGLMLDSFEVKTYPATDTPMDYIGRIISESGNATTVSMNNPGHLSGYTFVISSYDPDEHGVTFRFSYDTWGTGVTYAGYILLGIFMIGYFLVPNSEWRHALRQITMLLLLSVAGIFAADAGVSRRFASEFGLIPVNYNGRICPMSTLAKDYTVKLTGGSASFENNSADMVLAGFIFDFYKWKGERIIKIDSRELRKILGTEDNRVSFEQFFGAVSSGDLDIEDADVRSKYRSDIDRFEAVNMLVSGEMLKVFPVVDKDHKIRWLSPTDNIPVHIDGDQWMFIRKYLGLLNEQVQRNESVQQNILIDALKKYQHKVVGQESMPSETYISVEKYYNSLTSMRWPPIFIGMVGLMLFVWAVFSGRAENAVVIVGFVFALVSFIYITSLIVLRWIIGGHIPIANGYETMQLLAWILLMIAIVFHKNILILSMGILASGLAFGVAVLGGSGASVTGLQPVLDSSLLSVHVMLVMTAYALFLLMTLTGIAGIVKKGADEKRLAAIVNVMLYPAIALLAAGIFVGAVWANISWGRYWGWDPKEVWSLITLFIYSFAAHPRMMRCLRNSRVLMRFIVVAFISVLITYFGVNFILGGLHSYA